MQIKYCLPIIKHKKNDVLAMIQNHADYQYFEVWIDYIEDLDNKFIEELRNKLGDTLILLFRRKRFDPITMSFENRIAIIHLLANSKTFLDLDIINQKEELNYITHKRVHITPIISYHNYKETPSDQEFKILLSIMAQNQPLIYKIATFCNSENDALRLLQLQQQLLQEQKKHIILGMGPQGIITRVFATIWGNEFIFAPLTGASGTAPGQLTKTQLETIFKELII